jgi:prophage regulatory protein
MSGKNQAVTILRRKQVEVRTGLSCSSIYKLMSSDSFPRPINLGGKYSVGWIESEIEAWLAECIQQSRASSSIQKDEAPSVTTDH